MNKISNVSMIVIAEDVVSCDLDGEAAILNMNNGTYYGLDPIGAKIWNMLKNPSNLDNLVGIITKEYDVEKERCEKDLIELVNELIENGLVKVNAKN